MNWIYHISIALTTIVLHQLLHRIEQTLPTLKLVYINLTSLFNTSAYDTLQLKLIVTDTFTTNLNISCMGAGVGVEILPPNISGILAVANVSFTTQGSSCWCADSVTPREFCICFVSGYTGTSQLVPASI